MDIKRPFAIAQGVLWAAAVIAAAILHADPFFTTILLPALATTALLQNGERPCVCRLKGAYGRSARRY